MGTARPARSPTDRRAQGRLRRPGTTRCHTRGRPTRASQTAATRDQSLLDRDRRDAGLRSLANTSELAWLSDDHAIADVLVRRVDRSSARRGRGTSQRRSHAARSAASKSNDSASMFDETSASRTNGRERP